MKNNLLFILLFTSTFIFSQHINTRFIAVDKGATEKFEKGVAKKTSDRIQGSDGEEDEEVFGDVIYFVLQCTTK